MVDEVLKTLTELLSGVSFDPGTNRKKTGIGSHNSKMNKHEHIFAELAAASPNKHVISGQSGIIEPADVRLLNVLGLPSEGRYIDLSWNENVVNINNLKN